MTLSIKITKQVYGFAVAKLIKVVKVVGVMHGAGYAYSIQSIFDSIDYLAIYHSWLVLLIGQITALTFNEIDSIFLSESRQSYFGILSVFLLDQQCWTIWP